MATNLTGLNQIAAELHESAKAKGFWDESMETGTYLMLVVSELAEALEADRKGKYALMGRTDDLFTDPSKIDSDVEVFNRQIKDTFSDEIADTFIRLFDLAGYLEIDIERHIDLKMKYNQTRPYKHNKNY